MDERSLLLFTLIVIQAAAGVWTRRFTGELGPSPLQWLAAEQVRRARQLLEDICPSIEQVAPRSGLGTGLPARGTPAGSVPWAARPVRSPPIVDADADGDPTRST